MRLQLVGHSYKYAIEQIMLSMFPGERPVYSDAGSGAASAGQGGAAAAEAAYDSKDAELAAKSGLSYGEYYAQVDTIISDGTAISRGRARVRLDKLSDKLATDKLLQRAVKNSFFRAAEAFTTQLPVWGSLTGIRPAKIAREAMQAAASAGAAAGAIAGAAAAKTTGKATAGASTKTAAKTTAKAVAGMLARDYYVAPERARMCVEAATAAIEAERTLEQRVDVALYIGIPFCTTRCAYCSFVSNSVERSFDLVEPFTQTLLREIEEIAQVIDDIGLRTVAVYMGGGTPTALPVEHLSRILGAMHTSFDLTGMREFTVEAGRPDTITKEKLSLIRQYGANRVCVNPQSMSVEVLSAIGRRHTPADTLQAAELARECGAALNMDIIAGLPGDTPGGFRDTLEAVLDSAPENITVHTLSLKKGSRIMNERTAIPGFAAVKDMLDHAGERLRGRGYSPYYLYKQKFTSGGFENTGWSLPGLECIYNICMMEELCSVISLGGGGVTKLVSPAGRITRVFNSKYPHEYILSEGKTAQKQESIRNFYKTR